MGLHHPPLGHHNSSATGRLHSPSSQGFRMRGRDQKHRILLWDCEKVDAELLNWDNSTLYTPVKIDNHTMFLHPRTSIAYASSPPAPTHLYMLIRVECSSYLGATGSGQPPSLVHLPRNITMVKTHSQCCVEFIAAADQLALRASHDDYF